jgi:hypothetical protein
MNNLDHREVTDNELDVVTGGTTPTPKLYEAACKGTHLPALAWGLTLGGCSIDKSSADGSLEGAALVVVLILVRPSSTHPRA